MKNKIFKVQRSIRTTAPYTQMMIYDKSCKIKILEDITEDMVKLLGGRLKAYFEARIDQDGNIHIVRELKGLAW